MTDRKAETPFHALRPEIDRMLEAFGLHGKYTGLRRTRDDSLVEGFYFVIREDDPAGEVALLAYADACEGYAPELAVDLRRHVRDERLVRGLADASWER